MFLKEKIEKSKYVLYFKTTNIYQVEFFDNRLKMNNYIIHYDIKNYYIKKNR